jgi:hypothetical protein
MPYHQGSAVSVASIVTAAIVVVIGYRIGRAHAAWRDVRLAKHDVPVKRELAWGHTRPLLLGAFLLLLMFVVAAYSAGH